MGGQAGLEGAQTSTQGVTGPLPPCTAPKRPTCVLRMAVGRNSCSTPSSARSVRRHGTRRRPSEGGQCGTGMPVLRIPPPLALPLHAGRSNDSSCRTSDMGRSRHHSKTLHACHFPLRLAVGGPYRLSALPASPGSPQGDAEGMRRPRRTNSGTRRG